MKIKFVTLQKNILLFVVMILLGTIAYAQSSSPSDLYMY